MYLEVIDTNKNKALNDIQDIEIPVKIEKSRLPD